MLILVMHMLYIRCTYAVRLGLESALITNYGWALMRVLHVLHLVLGPSFKLSLPGSRVGLERIVPPFLSCSKQHTAGRGRGAASKARESRVWGRQSSVEGLGFGIA